MYSPAVPNTLTLSSGNSIGSIHNDALIRSNPDNLLRYSISSTISYYSNSI